MVVNFTLNINTKNINIHTGCIPFTQCSIFLNKDNIFFCNVARPEIKKNFKLLLSIISSLKKIINKIRDLP